MYQVYIPVLNRKMTDSQRASLIRMLKLAAPQMVFLVFGRILCSQEALLREQRLFCENSVFLQENGFAVGAWLAPTIGYGGRFDEDNGASERYTRIRFTSGKEAVGAYCPLDQRFRADFLNTVKAVAQTGVKKILLEDDFTLSGGKGYPGALACCCDIHLQQLKRRIGQEVSPKLLQQKLFEGGENPWRDAWVELQGETLKNLAADIEKTVHQVDPQIQIGLSANASSYEMEGIPFPELARIAAGACKPFVRMTGAPYWKNALTLSSNIEAIRVQSHWCADMERLTEGDTYPRPRHWVPAAFLEGYDMVLRADGGSSGILKYMLDYNSTPEYEPGYVIRHNKNQPHYREIAHRFSGKHTVGLNLFEQMDKFRQREYGEDESIESFCVRAELPLMSQWLTTDNSIPTAYGATDCASMVFGENARYISQELLQNGVILDAQAAKILAKAGIDLGLRAWERAEIPAAEVFPAYRERTIAGFDRSDGVFYDFTLDRRAEVHSWFQVSRHEGLATLPEGEDCDRYPACYFYENEKGQRFMVYSFVASSVYVTSGWNNGLFRNYCRQRQLAEGVKYLQGRPLPAMCFQCPELYILCKRDKNSMAVGLWNFFPDAVYTPEIFLDDLYGQVDFYNCDGRLEEDRVKLSTDILPYGFAFFTVYR